MKYKGQSVLTSICEVATVKTVNSIVVFLLVGNLSGTLIWVGVSTATYLIIRRFFNYLQVKQYRNFE